jgi:NADH-quinone oxidoreductase subunit L
VAVHAATGGGAVAVGHGSPAGAGHGAVAAPGGHDLHGGGHDLHGGQGAHGGHGHGEPHESGPRITVPLIVLATMAFVTMFANIPDWFSFFPESARLRFEHFVEPKGTYFVHDLAHAGFSPALALISLVLALGGIGLAYWYYFVKVYQYDPRATELPNGLTTRSSLARFGYRVLENKYYLDWLYTDVIVAFTKGALARATNRFNQEVIDAVVNGVGTGAKLSAHVSYDYIDQKVVDGLVNGSGIGATESGGILRRIQTGRIQQYAALLFAGAAILAGILVIAI